MSKIRQNLALAFLYNRIAIPIAAGALYPVLHTLVLSPMLAAIAMVLNDISVVGNTLLLRRFDLSKYHNKSKEVAEMAKDPVCGMEVEEEKAAGKSEYKGKTYYFCAPGCKKTFDSDPEKYIKEELKKLAEKAETCPLCLRARKQGGIAKWLTKLIYTTILRRRYEAYKQIHGKPPWV